MRIIIFSLAALAAAALGGAALGQTTSFSSGHRGGAHSPPPAGDFFRTHRGFRHDRDRHRRRHRDRFDRRPEPFHYGLGGYGEPGGLDGQGFFEGGGEVRMEGGRPVYDYDRSYPYEWASAAAPAWDWGEGRRLAEPRRRCAIERGVRVCRGRGSH